MMATEDDPVNAAADSIPPTDQAAELANLTAAASQHYAQKKYDAAAELYSQATALQVELNGEMNPENADLFYAYGRCLFQLGVSKSDVLGGKVAGDAPKDSGKSSKKRKRDAETKATSSATESSVKVAASQPAASKDGTKPAQSSPEPQPFFQLSGDGDEWEDGSDEEGQDQDDEGEDEDDLATAYEILDLARVLFNKKIEQLVATKTDTTSAKELLADVYDLQAEISLENERFRDAISDSKASLELKKELYPPEKGILAEAHFKLSLALEFASVTVEKDGDSKPQPEADSQVDNEMRNGAATEMESAIECTKLRLAKLTETMESAGGDSKASMKDLEEIREIISDMEQRLEDLKNPAISVNNAIGPPGAANESGALGGILGSMLGETPAAQKARIEEASKEAKDVSGLVRRKQPRKDAQAQEAGQSSGGQGKRKIDSLSEPDGREKRAKTEETET